MIALYIVLSLLLAVIAYLIVIIFFPVLKTRPQPMNLGGDGKAPVIPQQRQNVEFTVESEAIRGWLYLPDRQAGTVPCIVMNHGFCGTKDLALEAYALRFTAAGYAVLTYDYRHFGESDGEPRQLFHGLKQLDDIRAAITFARSRDEIDPEKIVVWGTSAGGNYGLVLAGEDPRIAAVIAQCSALDHKEDSRLWFDRVGFGFFLKLFMHAQRDKGRSRFGLPPHTYAAYGKPGTASMFIFPGIFESVEKLAAGSYLFRNEVCARFVVMPHAPDPLKTADRIRCPVQLLVCMKDEIVSPRSHLRISAALGDLCSVREYPVSHFDIYTGEPFENAIADQLEFLDSVL